MGACALLVAALSACSVVDPRSCTAVGGVSGVGFDLTEVVDLTAGGSVRICADHVCSDRVVRPDSDAAAPALSDNAIDGEWNERTVPVSVIVTDASGAEVYSASGAVTLEPWYPNGEGCEPTVFGAEVRAGADGSLQAVQATGS